MEAKRLEKGSQRARFVTNELKNGIQEKYMEAFYKKTALFKKITAGFLWIAEGGSGNWRFIDAL
ncbi:MAG: hypothetical protein IPH16_09435 [Haliscomenobacter sp.]|nr:hypothetical protein [Haliscomenobacter sp.]